MIKLLKTLNVLLVEDEIEIQKSLKESLEYFFQNVYTANNGLEALNFMQSNNNIHAIFTDYEMPHMNGYELTTELQNNYKKIPITIISNHDDKEKLQKCIPLGLYGYLLKPLRYEDFKSYLSDFANKLNKNGVLEYKISDTHTINFVTFELKENGTTYPLTKLESNFLKLLIDLDGKIATFENINEQLFEFETTPSTLKNLVYRLKTKYNLQNIKNIKDIGYILVNND